MQDRAWKASSRSEFRVGMQRIAVAAHPVQQRLLGRRGDEQLDVGRPAFGAGLTGWAAIPAPAAGIGPGHDHGLARAQCLAEVYVDAREIHGGRLGHAEQVHDVCLVGSTCGVSSVR